mmetsp:Transcript_41102/g.118764  ORF Transcript_41102/g.118764 Transcript_41102/m.118764 type:complete len:225 (-) Transcript_41102:344-1018(-)
MRSTTWKRGAKRGAMEWPAALACAPFSPCSTKRPRSRSPSRSVGSSGAPLLSRRRMRLICTTLGRRLKSSRLLSLLSCFSTSLMVGGLEVETTSLPSSSTSSCFRLAISGLVSMIRSVTSTTPEARPTSRRRATTSRSRSTTSMREVLSSCRPSLPFVRCSMVSTEKVQRVWSATSMVRASAPHLTKCQYFLELSESRTMLPATSLSIRRALSKPSVMGMNLGT